MWYPKALAIGMTDSLYWDGDPMAVCAYREADRIRADRENRVSWLNGLYAYQAIAAMAPALNPFSRQRRPSDYPRPVELDPARRAEEGKRRGLDYMRAVAAARNARGAGADGRGDR